jgi:hypothetical protein
VFEDKIQEKNSLEKTIIHELVDSLSLPHFLTYYVKVHAYDQCRAKVDVRNCVHHACTEVGQC